MKKSRLPGAVCALLSFVSVNANAVQLYLLNQFDANLYTTDTSSVSSSALLGSVSIGTDVVELVTVSGNTLYTVDRDSEKLITISATDASVLASVTLDQDITGHPRGYDLSPIDGLLYGVLPTMGLRTIDPVTGSTSLVTALTGANSIEAIAFAPDGTLYASAGPSNTVGTHLYTVNTTTGVMSLIGSMGIEIDTLTYASDGYLYGAQSGPGRTDLYRIDPSDGSRISLGDTGVDSIVGITSAVPIPAAVWLFSTGLLGLIGVARRTTA